MFCCRVILLIYHRSAIWYLIRSLRSRARLTNSKTLSIILACEHFILFIIEKLVITDHEKLNGISCIITTAFLVGIVIQSCVCYVFNKRLLLTAEFTAIDFGSLLIIDILKPGLILVFVLLIVLMVFALGIFTRVDTDRVHNYSSLYEIISITTSWFPQVIVVINPLDQV